MADHGAVPGRDNRDEFNKSVYISNIPVEQWPAEPDQNYPVVRKILQSDHGWIDLQNIFFERHHTQTPLTILGRCAYARTTIESNSDRSALLRLTLDDWAIVWLNGQKISSLRHDNGLRTTRVRILLSKGANELLIKTNNSETPLNNKLWVVNCAIGPGR